MISATVVLGALSLLPAKDLQSKSWSSLPLETTGINCPEVQGPRVGPVPCPRFSWSTGTSSRKWVEAWLLLSEGQSKKEKTYVLLIFRPKAKSKTSTWEKGVGVVGFHTCGKRHQIKTPTKVSETPLSRPRTCSRLLSHSRWTGPVILVCSFQIPPISKVIANNCNMSSVRSNKT